MKRTVRHHFSKHLASSFTRSLFTRSLFVQGSSNNAEAFISSSMSLHFFPVKPSEVTSDQGFGIQEHSSLSRSLIASLFTRSFFVSSLLSPSSLVPHSFVVPRPRLLMPDVCFLFISLRPSSGISHLALLTPRPGKAMLT